MIFGATSAAIRHIMKSLAFILSALLAFSVEAEAKAGIATISGKVKSVTFIGEKITIVLSAPIRIEGPAAL